MCFESISVASKQVLLFSPQGAGGGENVLFSSDFELKLALGAPPGADGGGNVRFALDFD